MDISKEIVRLTKECKDQQELYDKLTDLITELRSKGMNNKEIDEIIQNARNIIIEGQNKKIKSYLAQGMSRKKIADIFGLSSITLNRRIKAIEESENER